MTPEDGLVPVALADSRVAARAYGYLLLAALLVVGALGLGRPELAAVAAPFALLVVAGPALGRRRPPRLAARVTVDAERVVEGDVVDVTVHVAAERGVPLVEVMVAVPPGLDATVRARAARLAADGNRTLHFPVSADHWGAHALGTVHLRAWDRLHLVSDEGACGRLTSLKVLPAADALRALVRPAEPRAVAGHQVARTAGDGIEVADARPHRPGDQVRSVNWRATARFGELWVTEFHPERNTDVVILLDSFDATSGPRGSTLDSAVRAAAALAAGYLRRRDRVGFVSFGGYVRWVAPATGERALYQILDVLLETRVVYNDAWRDLRNVPVRGLPPEALVLALSPLVDERFRALVAALAARAFDVIAVDLSPLPFVNAAGPESRLALRLWALERDRVREQLQADGVAVVEWDPSANLDEVLVHLEVLRRGRDRRGVRR